MNKFAALLLFICTPFIGFAEEVAPPSENNVIIVCDNGLDMLAWDHEFIALAQQSIEINACFCGGPLLRKLIAACEERLLACPNLLVRFIGSDVLQEDEDAALIVEMQKRYPVRFKFQHTANVLALFPDYSTIDNHVKCVIIDEKYFSAGGTNLDELLCSNGTYTPERNKKGGFGQNGPAAARDQDVVGRGPMAKLLRVLFYKHFAMWEDYSNKNGTQFVRDPEVFKDNNLYWPLDPNLEIVVTSFDTDSRLRQVPKMELVLGGPMQKSNLITEAYVKLIKEARQEIVIGNMYFNPVPTVRKEFLNAANRGIDITLYTNGISEMAPSYTSLFCWANRINYAPLFYGRDFHYWDAFTAKNQPLRKTRIFEYNVKDILYHKKVMVVDRRYSIVGSYNLGTRSDSSDYEMVLVIDSPEVAQDLLEVFGRDRPLSVEVKPSDALSWYFDPMIGYIAGTQQQFHGFI